MLRTSVIVLFALGCASPVPAPEAMPSPRTATVAPDVTPQTWRPLKNQPPFSASEPLLLTDATVMVKELDSENWWRLTPDETGSYEHGKWTQLAPLPTGYIPLYFASAVLPDGKVIIEGGEYDNSQSPVESKRGAMYDPIADAWTELAGPMEWQQIGDAQGMVLADGTFMLGNCCDATQALFDENSMTWKLTGSGKQDANSEESWAMLPDGRILTVDVTNAQHPTRAEIYDPKTGMWSATGDTPQPLSSGDEIGPLVLRMDGTLLAVGDNGLGAVYDVANGTWTATPNLPMDQGQQLDIADGPGAIMPNGSVLLVASPGLYNPPATVWEWNGTQYTSVPKTPNCDFDPSYVAMLLVLPTGEVMLTDFSSDVELYTPAPGVVEAARPTITGIKGASGGEGFVAELYRGHTYTLEGARLNGITQGAYYGDDEQAHTNFPLVRVTADSDSHVRYFRTHDHSTMSIALDAEGNTKFDVPMDAEQGSAILEVVANGIASPAIHVDVK